MPKNFQMLYVQKSSQCVHNGFKFYDLVIFQKKSKKQSSKLAEIYTNRDTPENLEILCVQKMHKVDNALLMFLPQGTIYLHELDETGSVLF